MEEKELQKLSVKELRTEAIKLGLDEKDSGYFMTKKPLVAMITTLQAKERVKTLEPSEAPAEKKASDKRWLSKAVAMRKSLESQPKVRFMVPLELGGKRGVVKKVLINGREETVTVSGDVETVILNGYKTLIPRGVFVDIPEQIADVLSESHKLTSEAGSDLLIDRTDPETGRPVEDQL